MHHLSDLLELTPDNVIQWFEEQLGEKAYRARQVLEWVYGKGETRFDHMTNLSQGLRARLAELACAGRATIRDVSHSKDGNTAKFLFEFEDGSAVETVSMRDHGRHTVCVSSQVGCAMGCAFCATAGLGFVRNLSAGEMIIQVLTLRREIGPVNNAVSYTHLRAHET